MSGGSAEPAIATGLRAAVDNLRAGGIGAGDPHDPASLLALLRVLYATGRRDLPLGRLLEGHVDAVQIAHRYGNADQRAALGALVEQGATLGVWNAALPGEPLVLSGDRLSGGKAYASGAGVLTHALAAAETSDGPQLLLLPLERAAPEIDRTWWRTTGMQRSETHIVRWTGAVVTAADRIGRPHDYAREPWLSGGALRYVAVHAGGVAALLDHTRAHLTEGGRADDPHQTARLAELFSLATTAAEAVRGAAERGFDGPQDARLARVAAARLTVAQVAERASTVAREAVGLQAMFLTHPLAAVLSDLAVYLRQPAPDAQRARVGRAVAAGLLDPAL